MSAPLDQIEMKIAFLEKANAELSDAVYRQGREIEVLQIRLAELVARVEAAQSEQPVAPQSERPPHY